MYFTKGDNIFERQFKNFDDYSDDEQLSASDYSESSLSKKGSSELGSQMLASSLEFQKLKLKEMIRISTQKILKKKK